MDNFVVCSSKFTYSESDSVLYWCQPNTGSFKRLANFEVVIKRRYALVSYYGMIERLAIVLRGRNSRELEISLSEMSLLMQKIEKSFPEYRLYPDSRQQGILFRQYVSEVYERTAVTLPVDLVYQEAGWHRTPLNVPHYYSGNDTENCLSSFRLANQFNFPPQELVEWTIGLLSLGPMEVMLPL